MATTDDGLDSIPEENATGAAETDQTDFGLLKITFSFYREYSFYGNVVISPIICILGLGGNTIGMRVLWRDCRNQKLSIFRYLFALMLFDNIFLLGGLFINVIAMVEIYDWYLANWIFTYTSFGSGYVDFVIFHTSSVLLIVMALERLNALVRPFTVKRSWFSKYPLKIIVSIFVSSALIILPYPFCFEVIASEYENKTFYLLTPKSDIRYFYEQYSFAENVVSSIYPIIMLGINIAIPIAYCRVLKQRKMDLPNVSSNDTQQFKITLMVLWIAVMYILLSIPKIFLQTLIFIDSDYNFSGKYFLTFYVFTFTGDILARLNAANDFVIYILISKRYRRILRVMLCRCCISAEEYKNYSDIFMSVSQTLSKQNSAYASHKCDSNRQPRISVIDGVELRHSPR